MTRPQTITFVLPNFGAITAAPPLGLGYLAAAARLAGFEANVIDCERDNLNPRQLVARLRCEPPAIIGLSLFSSNYNRARRLIDDLRAALPNSTILIGGPHVTVLPVFSLRDTGADYAFTGEADLSLRRWLRSVAEGGSREPPAGVLHLHNGEIEQPTYPEPIAELDALPQPAWDLLAPERYPHRPHQMLYRAFPVAPIVTTRGCPFRCNFCTSGIPGLNSFRKRRPELVAEEIIQLMTRHHVREIQLEDDNFTLQREHVESFCNVLLERGIEVLWSCPNGVRVDKLDLELLRLMSRAGCYRIGLGIESFAAELREQAGKMQQQEQIKAVISWCREAGIQTIGLFMLGLPGETRRTMERTVRQLRRSRLDFASLGFFTPLPGTAFFTRFLYHRKLESIDWDTLNETIARPTAGLTGKELVWGYRRALIGFYLNPQRILLVLSHLRVKQALSLLHRLWKYRSAA